VIERSGSLRLGYYVYVCMYVCMYMHICTDPYPYLCSIGGLDVCVCVSCMYVCVHVCMFFVRKISVSLKRLENFAIVCMVPKSMYHYPIISTYVNIHVHACPT
jgi:hypothetical protein